MAPGVGPRARSDRAFERMYQRHVGDVYRYALAVLANPADAEDVTQTSFLNAYRAFEAGQRPERPLNWLITIAHNVCRQRFRDGERRPREVVLDREVADAPADEGEGGFRREDIMRALSELKFNQRAALVMRELEGRSYNEVAEILGISVGAVETLIFRARRAFREQLEGTLSCTEAEDAVSRDLDGRLSRDEGARLRAHLRSCGECATLARRFRAQRAAVRGIALVPLPPSLAGFSPTGGSGLAGGVALGGSLGIKAAVLGSSALLVAGVSLDAPRRSPAESVGHVARAALAPVDVPPQPAPPDGAKLRLATSATGAAPTAVPADEQGARPRIVSPRHTPMSPDVDALSLGAPASATTAHLEQTNVTQRKGRDRGADRQSGATHRHSARSTPRASWKSGATEKGGQKSAVHAAKPAAEKSHAHPANAAAEKPRARPSPPEKTSHPSSPPKPEASPQPPVPAGPPESAPGAGRGSGGAGEDHGSSSHSDQGADGKRTP